uniref:ATP synthase F0 subunit 8 n=1 Tax=Hishimonoides recurvatis TaxID=1970786 RepID=A0A499PFZ2_9HEMI|nr:ATP synthase F0 subunit 8 [Hishimonoides recurvatis]
MPQMAPMWWTMIMLTSLTILLVLMTINYFLFYKKMIKKSTIKAIKMNWTW